MEVGGLKELFQAVEIFADLNEAEILEVIMASNLLEVKAGTVIFDMGRPGDSMYLVQGGKVRILQPLPDGGREVLANLETGQVFGEMAMVDGSPRAAQAVAVTDCQLCQIDLQAFNRLRAAYSPAAFKVIRGIARVLSRRMRETNRRVVQFFENPERSIDYLRNRRPQTLEEGTPWPR